MELLEVLNESGESTGDILDKNIIYKDGKYHKEVALVLLNSKRKILLQKQPVVPAPIVENAVFLPLDGFGSLVEDQVTIGVWVHFWVFNSIPLVYLSVTIPVPCSFYHNCSVVKL